MPLNHILSNKLDLQRHFNTQESAMDLWFYWLFEENISIVNKKIEEEEKERKNQESEQNKNMPNINTSSMMNSANNMINKFK